MNRYVVAILTFLAVFGIASLIHKILEGFLDETWNSFIFKIILLISGVFLTSHFNKGVKQTNNIKNLDGFDFLIIAIVLIGFGMNNLFSQKLGTTFDYQSVWVLTLVKLTVGSIGEEYIYRGFIQTYINKGQDIAKNKISKGNYFATILMTLTHLGFFLIMEPIFAITSLFLVVIFSLTAGHLREKTNGLIMPIILHLTVNYLHFIIQINH